MNSEEDYLNKINTLTKKPSELFDRLKGKRDAFNYFIGTDLYVVGGHHKILRPVVKLCDDYSKDLYEKSMVSLKCLKESYNDKNHRAFLSDYNILSIYNRHFISQYDALLIDIILRLDEQEIERFTKQVYDYQIMFNCYINGN